MSSLTLGRLDVGSVMCTTQNLGSISGTVGVSVSSGSAITATATGAVQWTFTVEDNDMSVSWDLLITNGTTTQTFRVQVGAGTPEAVQWSGGSALALTSGVDLLRFTYINGRTVVYRPANNIS